LLRYLASDRRTGYRAAVVVSRKVHKSAVKRNRIRRRIYAVITEQQVHFQAPYDLVFTVLDETLADMPALKLHELIGGLLEKAGVTDPAKSSSTHATIVKKESKEA
jgi:ribonuclease P protein component